MNKLFWEFRELIAFSLIPILPRLRISNKIRPYIYRIAGISGLRNATIYGPITLMPVCGSRNISIGRNCFINTNLRIGSSKAKIFIGDNVRISPNVSIETTTHLVDVTRKSIHRNVVIGNNVWIGINSTVLPGVTIGDGSIIGACSLVRTDIPPNSLAYGTPARVMQSFD